MTKNNSYRFHSKVLAIVVLTCISFECTNHYWSKWLNMESISLEMLDLFDGEEEKEEKKEKENKFKTKFLAKIRISELNMKTSHLICLDIESLNHPEISTPPPKSLHS